MVFKYVKVWCKAIKMAVITSMSMPSRTPCKTPSKKRSFAKTLSKVGGIKSTEYHDDVCIIYSESGVSAIEEGQKNNSRGA